MFNKNANQIARQDIQKRRAQNMNSVCYRIITDEPQGFTVGFMPPPEMEFDEMPCKDTGGDAVYIFDSGVFIQEMHEELNGQWPEPDQYVWRTPEEYNEWAIENEYPTL